MWSTRYGKLTGLRFGVPAGGNAEALAEGLRAQLRQRVEPVSQGIALTPARRLALEASRGATDFGEYFTYFSFFIVVSALLLVVLFFRLGIEQRLRQIGVLRATGYTERHLRWMLSAEAAVIALAGGVLGVAGAIAYAALVVLRSENLVGRRGGDDAARAACGAGEPRDRLRGRHDCVAALRGAVAAGGVAAESAGPARRALDRAAALALDPRRARRSARIGAAAGGGGDGALAFGVRQARGAGRRILRRRAPRC